MLVTVLSFCPINSKASKPALQNFTAEPEHPPTKTSSLTYEQTYIHNTNICQPTGIRCFLPKCRFTDKLRKDLQGCVLNFRKPFTLCPTWAAQDLILVEVLHTDNSIFMLGIRRSQQFVIRHPHDAALVQNAKGLFMAPTERILLQAKHPKVSLNQHLHRLLKNKEKSGNWN